MEPLRSGCYGRPPVAQALAAQPLDRTLIALAEGALPLGII
jgi:hypothetical protein